MRDFINFVGRAALAGAIYPFLMLILFFGPRFGLLLFLGFFYWYLLPGAVVGIGLWLLAARLAAPPKAAIRFAVGTAISFVVALGIHLSNFLFFGNPDLFSVDKLLLDVTPMLLMAAAIGGVAGLASPKLATTKTEPLSYLERVRLYEAAEQQANAARRRLQSQPVR